MAENKTKAKASRNKFIGVTYFNRLELEVHECGCGFHIAVDADYMERTGHFDIECPLCSHPFEFR